MAAADFHYTFETKLGWAGIAWNDKGITRVHTPDSDAVAVERRLMRTCGSTRLAHAFKLPAEIAGAVDLLRRYAAGEKVELAAIRIDLDGIDDFRLAIYDAARRLAPGETVTYGELAKAAGYPGMARETGQALGSNPVPIIVPCHRILAAGGKIGGFSAPGGSRTKEKLLALEGVQIGQRPETAVQAAFSF